MPELQPHVAFDSKQRVVQTIRLTNILPMGDSSDYFGGVAIVVVADYARKDRVLRTFSTLMSFANPGCLG